MPQWNQQTTTSASRRAARTADLTVSGSAFAVPGESAVALNPYGLTSERPTNPMRSPPTFTITGRSAAAAFDAAADRLDARRMREPDRVEEGGCAVVARMVVGDGDHVETACDVRAAQQRGRPAEVELLVRDRHAARRDRAFQVRRRHVRGAQRPADARPRVVAAERGDAGADLLAGRDVTDRGEQHRAHPQHPRPRHDPARAHRDRVAAGAGRDHDEPEAAQPARTNDPRAMAAESCAYELVCAREARDGDAHPRRDPRRELRRQLHRCRACRLGADAGPHQQNREEHAEDDDQQTGGGGDTCTWRSCSAARAIFLALRRGAAGSRGRSSRRRRGR